MDSLAAAVASQMDRARADLTELVAFPSVFDPAGGGTPVGDAAAEWVAGAFREAGIDPTPQEVDHYRELAEEVPPWSEPADEGP